MKMKFFQKMLCVILVYSQIFAGNLPVCVEISDYNVILPMCIYPPRPK